MTRPDPAAEPGLSTRAIHAGSGERRPGEPVVPPLVSSATFFTAPEPEGEVLYGRYANTEAHRRLAQRIAALEGTEGALVCGSGMAAISLAVLAFAGAGDHIVAADSLYGGTLVLFDRELPRLGIDTTYVDPDADWTDAIRPETRLLYMEAPVNPTLRVHDPRPVAEAARRHGIPLVMDATFATPINFRPAEHGVDVVIHSATKYLGGHSDLVAGVLAGRQAHMDTARERLKAFGPSLDPHALWLLERGLKTLALRVQRQNATALLLARWLEGHDAVSRVHYPGLRSHPDHDRATELFDGFGGMLAFVVRGGDAAARRVLGRLRLMAVAPSLGGVESLVSMPRYTSHAAMTDEERRAAGIEEGFVRVSVGVEDAQDLQAELAQALEAAEQ